jgi:hypothetical protein
MERQFQLGVSRGAIPCHSKVIYFSGSGQASAPGASVRLSPDQRVACTFGDHRLADSSAYDRCTIGRGGLMIKRAVWSPEQGEEEMRTRLAAAQGALSGAVGG